MPSDLLKELLKKAHDGSLVLPDFQRDFVWKPGDVTKLLSSLLNGYPIGGLLFMESGGDYGARLLDGVIARTDPPRERKDLVLILDGQQRLTSCYRALYGALRVSDYPGRYYFDYKAYVEDPQVTGSDVENLVKFIRAKEVERSYGDTAKEQAAGMFPLDIIFGAPRGADYSAWLSGYTFSQAKGDAKRFDEFSKLQSGFIRTFIEPITAYQVHYEQIKRDTSPDVICTVFEAINTTGKRLTVFDLLVARCAPPPYVIKLREWLGAAVERKTFSDFDGDAEDLCTTHLPRIIALHTKRTSKRGELLTLKPDYIREHWSFAVDALERAIQALSDRFGCLGSRFMPLSDIIPPLALILASDQFHDTQEQWEKVSIWYWRCVFSQYFSGAPDSKVAKTVKEWLGNGNGGGWLCAEGREPESVREFTYRTSLLDDVSRVDTALYRGVMSMLLAANVKDWGKDKKLLRRVSWRDIEDHHIYPARFLEPYGIKGSMTNNIANRTPILGSTNKAIGKNAPHVYMKDVEVVGPRGLSEETLRQHCVAAKLLATPFTEKVYKDFLADRTQRLLSHIQELVGVAPLQDD